MNNHRDNEFVQAAAAAAVRYITSGETTGNDGSVAGDDVSFPLDRHTTASHIHNDSGILTVAVFVL